VTKNVTFYCCVCGAMAFAQREHAIYCSGRCRKRAQRMRAGRRARGGERALHYSEAEKRIKALASLQAWGSMRSLIVMSLAFMPETEQQKIRGMM